MTTDLYHEMLFSDGEEVTPDDLNAMQDTSRAVVMDQLLESVIPQVFTSPFSFDADFWGLQGDEPRRSAFCVSPGAAYLTAGSANNKVSLGRGVLMQKIANQNGNSATLLPFSFGTNTSAVGDLWTIANGDVTNPRIDLLQMSLSVLNDTSVSRLTKTNPVKAILNLALHTADVTTVLRAKIGGFGGNSISVSLQKRTSGSGISYSENGNAVTILYENGVSTVALLEASIVANSTLLEIQSTGAVATLSDPADSFTATHLVSGVDALIVNTSINTQTRVQCVLSVKAGTPAASPVIPTPDSGACVVGMVVVGAGWTSATAMIVGKIGFIASHAYICDNRMPLGVRSHRVDPTAFKLVTAFSLSDSNNSVTATNATNELFVMCPVGVGRVVAVGVFFGVNPYPNSSPAVVRYGGMSSTLLSSYVDRSRPDAGTTAPVGLANSEEHFGVLFLESSPTDVPTSGLSIGGEVIGLALWANGTRAARPKFAIAGGGGGVFGGSGTAVGIDQFAVHIVNVTNGTKIGAVTFYVAEGL